MSGISVLPARYDDGDVLNVPQFLNNTFPSKMLSIGGQILWSACSTNLSPLEFFLWGSMSKQLFT